MFKVLVFTEAEVYKMEDVMNQYSGWSVEATWVTNSGKLVLILRQLAKAGRPKKTEEE